MSTDVVAQISHRWGAINLLINNAGVNFNHSLPETTVEEYQRSFEINCLAAIRTTAAVLPDMRKANAGSDREYFIHLMGTGLPTIGLLLRGKYALAGYTDALRQSLIGTGIHVLGVYPGLFKTDMTHAIRPAGFAQSPFSGKPPIKWQTPFLKPSIERKPNFIFPGMYPGCSVCIAGCR